MKDDGCGVICFAWETASTGTLVVLIKAKQEGYIDAIKPILHQMVEKDISL